MNALIFGIACIAIGFTACLCGLTMARDDIRDFWTAGVSGAVCAGLIAFLTAGYFATGGRVAFYQISDVYQFEIVKPRASTFVKSRARPARYRFSAY